MSYTVPTNGKPTSPSRKAWVGAAIGSIIFPGVGTAIGAFIGYQKGKQQAQAEMETGQKSVPAPTFWNARLAKSSIMSGVIGLGIMVGGVLAGAAIFPVAPIAAGLIGVAGYFTGGAVAAFRPIVSGFKGKAEMRQEYQAAKQYYQHRAMHSAGRMQTATVDNSRAYQFDNHLAHEREAAGRPTWGQEVGQGQGRGARGMV